MGMSLMQVRGKQSDIVDTSSHRARKCAQHSMFLFLGFWKDPPNYFAEIVYPAYLTYNRPALDTLERAETHDRIEGLIGLDSEELDIASMVGAAVDNIVESVEKIVVDGEEIKA